MVEMTEGERNPRDEGARGANCTLCVPYFEDVGVGRGDAVGAGDSLNNSK
jgi:hypothetical protein